MKLSFVTHTGIILLSVSFHIHLCPLIGVCMLLVFHMLATYAHTFMDTIVLYHTYHLTLMTLNPTAETK